MAYKKRVKTFPTWAETRMLRLCLKLEELAATDTTAILFISETTANHHLVNLMQGEYVQRRRQEHKPNAYLYSATPKGRSMALLAAELGIGDLPK